MVDTAKLIAEARRCVGDGACALAEQLADALEAAEAERDEARAAASWAWFALQGWAAFAPVRNTSEARDVLARLKPFSESDRRAALADGGGE